MKLAICYEYQFPAATQGCLDIEGDHFGYEYVTPRHGEGFVGRMTIIFPRIYVTPTGRSCRYREYLFPS
jgi:hypothetical protein